MIGCAGPNVTEPAPAPPPREQVVTITEIDLPILSLASPFPRDAELRGLVTMSVVLGLGDIPGVVPVLQSQAQPLSTAIARPIPSGRVRATFTGGGTPEALSLSLELCKEGGLCTTVTANGSRDAPYDAIGTLLDGTAKALAVPVTPEVSARWHQPGSADPYAELVTGRACAVWLGLLPPSTRPGDRRADPVARALYLDPKEPLAAWIYGLWQVGTVTGGGTAAEAFQRAVVARPTSPLLGADLALARGLQGRPAEAVVAWEDVLSDNRDDLRFLKPYADALVVAGRANDAKALLDKLPSAYDDDPQVAALRVAVAEAAHTATDMDALLAHWQEVDPTNAEPVRRRVDLRVKGQKYADALPLVDILRQRAPGPDTDALEMALLVAVGRPQDAARYATADVAPRLLARAARENDPGADLTDLGGADPAVLLARADAALWRNDGAKAVQLADKATLLDPTNVDAELVRAQAYEAQGHTAQAVATWAKAWWADPAAEGGPVESGRIASTFTFAEAAKPAAGPTKITRPKGPLP